MDFLDCKVCNVRYDEEEHRPRNAPCGHELCSACIRALIKHNIFECPKCRQKSQVCVADDLPVCFGLIDVIRAFKIENISLHKAIETKTSGASNDVICKAHNKIIGHRCLKCCRWICIDCLNSHTTLTGCSTIGAATAVKIMKEEHIESVDMLISDFEGKANFLNSKIQKHNANIKEISDKKKEVIERAEKQVEELSKQAEEKIKELKKIEELLDHGNNKKENVKRSKNELSAADSPSAVMDKIEVLEEMKQELRSWSVKNLGTDISHGNTSQDIIKALKENKHVYFKAVFKDQVKHAKVLQNDDGIYFSTFRDQSLKDGSMTIPVDRFIKLLSISDFLVFVELSLGGVVKGRLLIHLNKDLPNIKENMLMIVMGQKGQSLSGLKVDYNWNGRYIRTDIMPFSGIPVNPDKCESYKAKRGDVTGRYNKGYLEIIYFHVGEHDFNSDYRVLGSITAGINILQVCHDKRASGVLISDCGLLIQNKK